MIDNVSRANIATVSILVFLIIYCLPIWILWYAIFTLNGASFSFEDPVSKLILSIDKGSVDIAGYLHKLMLPLITFISGFMFRKYFGKIRTYSIMIFVAASIISVVLTYYWFEVTISESQKQVSNYVSFGNFFTTILTTLGSYFTLLLGLSLSENSESGLNVINTVEEIGEPNG